MNVLIVENEIYLAQHIAGKLTDMGHKCFITSSISEAVKTKSDLVLLSVNAVNNVYDEIIETHKNNIIILMVPYVSNNTVDKPMKLGARDYVIKPFSINELFRKIEHYKEHIELIEYIGFFNNYFSFIQNQLQTPQPLSLDLPLLIKANAQRNADIYAMEYAIKHKIRFDFLNIKFMEWNKYVFDKEQIYYIINAQELKKNERKMFLDFIKDYNFIVSIVTDDEIDFPNIIDITNKTNGFEIGSEILSIKDYEKMIITKFEGRYSDIELAKKLGMSRKSLWEKRKKYGIAKRK